MLLIGQLTVRGTSALLAPASTYTQPILCALTRHTSTYPNPFIDNQAYKKASRQLRLRRQPGLRHFTTKHSSLPPNSTLSPYHPPWSPPSEASLSIRPVLIVGAGNLGRRIATIWASDSRPVVLYDNSLTALASATEYITDSLASYCAVRGTHPGSVTMTTCIQSAADGNAEATPWMVIDCLPEDLVLKKSNLAEVEKHLRRDCILATNSSSFRAELLADAVPESVRGRVLNTHYFIPPRNRMVEIMSTTHTADAETMFSFLVSQMRRVGLEPVIVPAGLQSTGFVFNRVWAAVKRETLAVVKEGVASPKDVDALFRDFFHSEKGPCERMDEVGLDRVMEVEKMYVDERPGLGSDAVVEWLGKEYVSMGRVGEKGSSGDGLFTKEERDRLKEMRKEERKVAVEESKGA
ncbi:NAD(P)-binding protein [Coniochaeta ligniaria NRRL 30616]|uniref:NAD(P)-binding protein n=1 Tax=Coniochaeta ligniaria NRRL 30616 TaxID=1408157 RepID=A0A1J7IYH6_9PEZI|nr:NAD(P)-binding protein [Coniochaeta ligniaria NRRL 30616]